MKNIFFLLMICSFTGVSCSHLQPKPLKPMNERLYDQRIADLKKSTVQITQYPSPDREFRGSGSLIHIKKTGQSWIMTNAHVCVYDFANYTNSSFHRNHVFPKRELKLNIDGKNGFVFVKVKGSDLGLDYKKDFCLIPVNKKDFPKKQFTFIDSQSRPEVVEFARNKKDGLMMFTLNYAERGEVLIKKGSFKRYEDPVPIQTTEDDFYIREKGALSTIDIIPGDSGSVIVNKNLDVIGVAYGTDVNLAPFMNSGDVFQDLNTCLERNKIKNKRDLAFMNKDLKEIDGAFYPISFFGK